MSSSRGDGGAIGKEKSFISTSSKEVSKKVRKVLLLLPSQQLRLGTFCLELLLRLFVLFFFDGRSGSGSTLHIFVTSAAKPCRARPICSSRGHGTEGVHKLGSVCHWQEVAVDTLPKDASVQVLQFNLHANHPETCLMPSPRLLMGE